MRTSPEELAAAALALRADVNSLVDYEIGMSICWLLSDVY